MFDNAFDSWESKRFGSVVSMRCIIKAAAMVKYGADFKTSVADLRALLKRHSSVTPPQWFQAMLSQGVLLLNAALTTGGEGISATEHNRFWTHVVQEIVEQILKAKAQQNDSVVFAWWGTESLKTKKALARLFAKYEGQVRVEHIEHANPAAQGDLFCRPKASPHPHFAHINAVLTRAGRPEVDWLPDAAWLAARAPRAAGGGAGAMADFIAQTKELHKLYLERLQSGLEHAADLPPIRGILASEGVGLLEACAPLGLAPAAGKSLRAAEALPRGALSLDEAAAVHMYTGNALYARLNEALRHPNRGLVARYVPYLRLLLAALARLLAARAPLFRGIRKDLAAAYPEGATVTWWSVSSCTPDVAVAKGFGGGQKGGTLFRVQAEAVPIMGLSAFKGEEEYVLAPGTQLKVVKVDRDPAGAVVISLEEQPGPRLVS